MSLGRKQSIPDLGTWLRVMEDIDPHRADALFDQTVRDVARFAAGKRVAFAWSGGKDSLALQIVMEAAGINDCVLVISELEYPAFLQWSTDHMPRGLQVRVRPIGYEWLRAHPEMLFPQGRYGPAWFKVIQHTGQTEYFREQGLDLLALGRRKADGNYCGQRWEVGTGYTNRQGVTRWSPIADWSHEDTLAILKREKLELPPCYGWPRGFQIGTGPWPARQWTKSREHGWAEVKSIDPEVVEAAAAEGIPGAAEAL